MLIKAVLWIRVPSDPYNFPGSVPECTRNLVPDPTQMSNKINWKEKFNKVCLCLGPTGPNNKENHVKIYYISTGLGTLPL
jgi:hypothetical protein